MNVRHRSRLIGQAVALSVALSTAVRGGEKEQPDRELLPVEQLRAVATWVSLDGLEPAAENPKVRAIFDGKPHPCICVTGIYPRKRQIERLAATFKIEPDVADRECMLIDFNLERQIVVEGAKDEAPWTDIDVQLLRDVLQQAEGLTEAVRDEFLDAAISMPLPWRSRGDWGREISHSELKKDFQTRYRAGQTEDLPPGRADVLLFRYIDFAAEPEQQYRYRVRVEILNPRDERKLSGRRTGEDSPSTVLTPWSEPTEAISISAEPPVASEQPDK